MPGTRAQVIAAELERVESKLPVLYEREGTFFSKIEKRPALEVSGRNAIIPMEIRPGGKPGHVDPDGGDYGRGDMPTYDKASVPFVTNRYAIEFTDLRMWVTDSNRKAVLDSFRRDVASAMGSFRRYMDSLHMTAGNGVLATVTTVTPAAGTDTYVCTTDGYGVRLLAFGYDYRVFDSTLATDRTAAGEKTVTLIDYANKTFQGLSVAGAVAGDKIVASGLSSTPPVSILGVPYHYNNASTGTWLGFNRATTPEIRANRVNANGAALSFPMPRLAINKIGDRIGMDSKLSLEAWTHPAQKQAYEEFGHELTRVQEPKGAGLDLYFGDNMRIAGAPIKVSYSWDRTRIDFIDFSIWGRTELHPVQWRKDKNGNRFYALRGTSGGIAAAEIAYIVTSQATYINNPPKASYIDGLDVPSGY